MICTSVFCSLALLTNSCGISIGATASLSPQQSRIGILILPNVPYQRFSLSGLRLSSRYEDSLFMISLPSLYSTRSSISSVSVFTIFGLASGLQIVLSCALVNILSTTRGTCSTTLSPYPLSSIFCPSLRPILSKTIPPFVKVTLLKPPTFPSPLKPVSSRMDRASVSTVSPISWATTCTSSRPLAFKKASMLSACSFMLYPYPDLGLSLNPKPRWSIATTRQPQWDTRSSNSKL
mmetsp:Transcript_26474/g.55186  ORF Transcript_26474/g.55186 Transcript_26474/m.55186 type:complete len:235 (-) Transcript_26474:269-973(-)